MRGKEPVNHRSHRPRSKESPSGIRFIGGHLLYRVQFFTIAYDMLLWEHSKQYVFKIYKENLQSASIEIFS